MALLGIGTQEREPPLFRWGASEVYLQILDTIQTTVEPNYRGHCFEFGALGCRETKLSGSLFGVWAFRVTRNVTIGASSLVAPGSVGGLFSGS